MTWAALIAALIEVFGPILVEWLKRWLEDRLKTAATHLPEPTSFAHHSAPPAALFDKAISLLPPLAFARRTLLRRLRASAVKRADALMSGQAVAVLTADERAELREAAGAAGNE